MLYIMGYIKIEIFIYLNNILFNIISYNEF